MKETTLDTLAYMGNNTTFDFLLNVHLSIILAIDQLNAQILVL